MMMINNVKIALYAIAVPVRNVNKSGVRTLLATGGHVTFLPYCVFVDFPERSCLPKITNRHNPTTVDSDFVGTAGVGSVACPLN